MVVRCDRLAPNIAVAQSAVTATTVPKSAVPTGTEAEPRPRSSAWRMPITALGGAPVALRRATISDGWN